jgi:hypothetical protein
MISLKEARLDTVPGRGGELAGPEVFAAKPSEASGTFGMEFVVLHTRLAFRARARKWAYAPLCRRFQNVVVN